MAVHFSSCGGCLPRLGRSALVGPAVAWGQRSDPGQLRAQTDTLADRSVTDRCRRQRVAMHRPPAWSGYRTRYEARRALKRRRLR